MGLVREGWFCRFMGDLLWVFRAFGYGFWALLLRFGCRPI